MCRWPVLAPDAPLAQRWLNAGWGMRNSSGMGLRIPGEPPVAGLVPDGPAAVERVRPWPPMAGRRRDRAVLRGKADQMECGTWATPQVPPGCARPVRPRAAAVVASVERTWPAPASGPRRFSARVKPSASSLLALPAEDEADEGDGFHGCSCRAGAAGAVAGPGEPSPGALGREEPSPG